MGGGAYRRADGKQKAGAPPACRNWWGEEGDDRMPINGETWCFMHLAGQSREHV